MSILLGIFLILPGIVHLLYAGQALLFFELCPTGGISKLLNGLPKNHLAGVCVAACYMRIVLETIDSKALRFLVDKGGYAASSIAKTLEKKGGQLAAPPEGFFVTNEQGLLNEGELERAAEWAGRLVMQ